jgi:hypothetical protein
MTVQLSVHSLHHTGGARTRHNQRHPTEVTQLIHAITLEEVDRTNGIHFFLDRPFNNADKTEGTKTRQ